MEGQSIINFIHCDDVQKLMQALNEKGLVARPDIAVGLSRERAPAFRADGAYAGPATGASLPEEWEENGERVLRVRLVHFDCISLAEMEQQSEQQADSRTRDRWRRTESGTGRAAPRSGDRPYGRLRSRSRSPGWRLSPVPRVFSPDPLLEEGDAGLEGGTSALEGDGATTKLLGNRKFYVGEFVECDVRLIVLRSRVLGLGFRV